MRQEKLAKQAERLATKKRIEPASGVDEVGERGDQKGLCYWVVSTTVGTAVTLMMAALILGVAYYVGGF